ncbi:cobalamin biosynthesis protein CobW [Arachnia propionica]|uniref:Cobalamin biosynthesis protein CobW n=1 Tax=Arachnia propionica TaxID=1750 RepID=A0A3P1T999_9ACTN|nr:GTP-binding protein [Arachnia propionica]RRD05939.1 cobalamin biosynthesis protein CobW [Arachnia propionica]
MTSRIVLVAAFDQVARATATSALLFDLPDCLVIQHDLSPSGELNRRIWDTTGVLECDSVTLGHGCVSCATREDLVPTLIRILDQRTWTNVVVSLPLTAAPEAVTWQVIEAIQDGSLPAQLAAVLTVVDETTVVDDVFGDATLEDLGLTLSAHDERAAGEAVCAQMDFADVVATLGPPDEATRTALSHLLGDRPGCVIHELDADALMSRSHDFLSAQARVDPTGPHQHAAHDCNGVWTLVLSSDRPLHPGRLYEQVELIGAGRLRSRGRTWVPSRPEMVVAWDGAGGQLSIGDAGLWGDVLPHTRLVITGIDAADRGRVERAFHDILLTDWEMHNVTNWEGNDGLDLWLGAVDQE